jgi:hypothetical protein
LGKRESRRNWDLSRSTIRCKPLEAQYRTLKKAPGKDARKEGDEERYGRSEQEGIHEPQVFMCKEHCGSGEEVMERQVSDVDAITVFPEDPEHTDRTES